MDYGLGLGAAGHRGELAVIPDQLFKAFSDALIDVCGHHSPVRKEPITPAEWQELNSRWEMILLMNRESDGTLLEESREN